MTIAIDHRPNSLDEIIGNQSEIKALKALFARPREKFPHAILLTGPKGCGKTSVARIIAKELGAEPADFIELDTAQFSGKDTITSMISQTRLKPSHQKSKCRVWLLDEAHMIGVGGQSEKNKAQSALLKTLENPPPHAYFILATTNPEQLLETVRSRCQTYRMSQLSDDEMMSLIVKVSRAEKVRIPQEVRELIVEQSFGHPRNALQILGKVIGMDASDQAAAVVEEAAKQSAAIELARALIGKKPWKTIAEILNGLKNEDEEGLRRLVLSYCNTILLKGNNTQAFIVMEEFESPFYNTGKPGLTLACYRATFSGE